MKLRNSLAFIELIMSSGAAFATCVQPSGTYSGPNAGVNYYEGQTAAITSFTTLIAFTSQTQGTFFQIGRFQALNTPSPTPPQILENQGTFSLASGGSGWIPAYCGGELTVTFINPPNPGPLTQTYAYTSTNSGKNLSLTYISGTFQGGLQDYLVSTGTIRLEQQ